MPPAAPADDDMDVGGRMLLTSRVTETIRTAIVSGKLTAGERLSVPDLARRLGVSRTPTREALLALEREGLVRPRPGSGMEVLHGGVADLREILEVREGLEAMVARLAAERMSPTVQQGLRDNLQAHRAALQSGDIDEHVALDHNFHALLREGAGNERLTRLLDQVAQQLRVLNRAISGERGWSAATIVADHQSIADGVLHGDADAAERAIRQHVRRVRDFWQKREAAPAIRRRSKN